jgi:hypothetical protein
VTLPKSLTFYIDYIAPPSPPPSTSPFSLHLMQLQEFCFICICICSLSITFRHLTFISLIHHPPPMGTPTQNVPILQCCLSFFSH